MSIFNDKATKSVAEAAAKIMEAELSAKQKQIAKIAEPKHKIDAGDLAKLRAGHKPVKEESEQLDEYQSTGGVYKHKGTYGGTKGAEYGSTEWDKEEKESKKMTKPAPRKLGARQNYVRSTRINESFTEMLSAYNEQGLKAFVKDSQEETIQEEPDNEQFTKEFEDQKASMEGKKKQPSVAAASTQGVKNMPEEVEVIDFTDVNQTKQYTIELKDLQEKTLTKPEMKKKEEVVKSMKKKLPGFKERYGERAKSVMYATATNIAKEKA